MKRMPMKAGSVVGVKYWMKLVYSGVLLLFCLQLSRVCNKTSLKFPDSSSLWEQEFSDDKHALYLHFIISCTETLNTASFCCNEFNKLFHFIVFFTFIFIHQGKKASRYYTLLIILYFTEEEEEEENEEVKRKDSLGRSLSEQSNLGVNINL